MAARMNDVSAGFPARTCNRGYDARTPFVLVFLHRRVVGHVPDGGVATRSACSTIPVAGHGAGNTAVQISNSPGLWATHMMCNILIWLQDNAAVHFERESQADAGSVSHGM